MSTQYPGLNLASATMRQPTVEPSKTVYDSVEMWQVCPAGRGRAAEEIWNKRETQKHEKTMQMKRKLKAKNNKRWYRRTCRTELYIHSEIQFLPSFVSFVLLPLTFFSVYYSSKRECHFSFSRCQRPSALLSETSAIISLSYYRSDGGPFIQSVTFTETSDIRWGTAALFHWNVSAQQMAGCSRRGSQNWFRRWTDYSDETLANWGAGRQFEHPASMTSGSVSAGILI